MKCSFLPVLCCVVFLSSHALLNVIMIYRLAASIVAEEGGDIEYSASTSAAQIVSEEEDFDADEEMIVVSKILFVHGNSMRD